MKYFRLPLRTCVAAFCAGPAFFSANSLFAQAKTTSAPSAPAATETVQLDPFSVISERDYGYLANNSNTATGSG